MAAGVFVKDIAVTDGWEMQIVRFEPGARHRCLAPGGRLTTGLPRSGP